MESMLDYIDKLNVFREDEVTNGDDREHVEKNAPAEKKEGTYMVPKTFA